MDDNLDTLEPWLGGLLAKTEPRQRMALARAVGQIMRRTNAARVMANVEPDGTPMAERKPKKPRKGQKERKGKAGRMFKRIELARNMQIQPSADDVTLSFKPRIAQTAKEHHFGLEAPVDRRIRNSIRVRYKARRLLGIAAADREAMLGKVMDWLDKR
ncbi:phage virion morphogenesis protein [Novosphingobium sp. KACC 22771]|uniref:phage virion morphogenesis protein n=1 Tax=Novosphingobium sp. KACC 22771 TaxID=3025670 RepID=UPI00236592FB|nr:phage virion morphogenesis protein [Novosphingobium sp. KACC 22771]WDF71471.1 phage virion morphogenesis protein [Novosphingobium sp. KACC 22771]